MPAEPLLFERSAPGARGVDLPPCDVPAAEVDPAHASFTETGLPEVGQADLVRHYTRLSRRNFCVDANTYPLASCTMKYSPKAYERLAALPGFAALHPLQDPADCQGAMELLYELRVMLAEVAGLDEVSLQPSSGPHGEWTMLRMVLAYFADAGQPRRRTVLLPDTAHGTNFASCAQCGAPAVAVKTGPDGLIDVDDLRRKLDAADGAAAALFLANPNTVGRFESLAGRIVQTVHDAGAMVCLDGVNLNAALGLTRPGDWGVDAMHFLPHKTFAAPHGSGGPGAGPVAVREHLAAYLPCPQVVRRAAPGSPSPVYAWEDRPKSVGRVRSFWGQFGVLARAYCYLRSCGPDGLRRVAEAALLAANYLAQRVKHAYALPYGPPPGEPMAAAPCGNQFVTTPHDLVDRGVSINDLAKALIDHDLHPPAVHWPLRDCLTFEPAETESLADLDALADALLAIAGRAATDPASLREAPATAPVRRVDEMAAARSPVLAWVPRA